jgi:hypothetical protein
MLYRQENSVTAPLLLVIVCAGFAIAVGVPSLVVGIAGMVNDRLRRKGRRT